MSSKYSRRMATENEDIKWLREYVEEHELGPAINEIADHLRDLRDIFLKVGRVEGGVGVVSALIQGLRNHGKGERKQ